MPRRIVKDPSGLFWLEDQESGHKIGGPYPTRGKASDANIALGDKPERAQARQVAAEALKSRNLKVEVARANANPKILSARGRPAKNDSIPYRIALEVLYLWHSEGKRSVSPLAHRRIIVGVAKQFRRAPRFVRTCVIKYDALHQDDQDTIKQLRWETQSPRLRAREELPPKRAKGVPGAKTLLQQALSKGPANVKELYRRGKDAGFSERTMDRAKKELGVQSLRSGAMWLWVLPQSDQGCQ